MRTTTIYTQMSYHVHKEIRPYGWHFQTRNVEKERHIVFTTLVQVLMNQGSTLYHNGLRAVLAQCTALDNGDRERPIGRIHDSTEVNKRLRR